MNLNIRADINILGGMLLILAACFVLPLIVSIIYLESACIKTFYILILFCLFSGLLLKRFTKNSSRKFGIRDGFLAVSSIWIVLVLLGTVPYLSTGSISSFIPALFESCSGFSTTGASATGNLDNFPKTILFFRAYSSWLGGFFVLLLAGSIIPWLNMNNHFIVIDTSSLKSSIDQHSNTITFIIAAMYFGMTAFMLILLKLGGLNFFDGLCHSFSTVSTGGFNAYSDGVDHFGSSYIKLITIVFMFLAAINYNIYIMAIKHGFKTIFKNRELRLYVAIIFSAALIIFISLSINDGISYATSGNALFHAVSFLSTTGFTTTNYNGWPNLSLSVILILIIIGGCMGSTAGGIKIYRLLIILKMIKRSVGMRLHPNAVIDIRIAGKAVPNEMVIKAISFLMLYIVTMVTGILILSLDNLDFMTTVSAVLSCLGNVGPGLGLCGPASTYECFSEFSQLVLAILMIAGRLELFSFMAVFSPLYWDTTR